MKPYNNKQRKQDSYSHCNEPDEDGFIRVPDEFLEKMFPDLYEQTDEDEEREMK